MSKLYVLYVSHGLSLSFHLPMQILRERGLLSKFSLMIYCVLYCFVVVTGSVPSSIVNKVTANQPQSVAILKQCVEKMYKEELDNPNSTSQFKANAMSYLEKIERAKNGMQSATSAETTQASDEKQPQSKPVASVNGNVVGRESEVRLK